MFRIAALIGLIASPALADAVVVTDCMVEESNVKTHIIRCDVENNSDTAIARLNHSIEIFQNDRTVPWAAMGDERRPESVLVRGGIEPGETINIVLGYFDIYQDVPVEGLYGEITSYAPLDVNGDPIASPSSPSQ